MTVWLLKIEITVVKHQGETGTEDETETLPFDDPRHVLSFQAFNGGVDLQMLLQSDPRPQRVHLWTVAHVLQRIVHWAKLSAVVSQQHLDQDEQRFRVFSWFKHMSNMTEIIK